MTTMIKKQDKPIGCVSFQIGTMMRTIDVYAYGWGVSVSVRDKTEKGQTMFDHRDFNMTKKYPNIESNIRRGMRYYKASNLLIDEVLKQYAKRLVWVVTQESCANGEINFNVVVCNSEETAKAQMQKEIDWLKNESIHFRDFDKGVEEFEVEQEDCRFFLNDTWDDYYEEIIVMEKEITTL